MGNGGTIDWDGYWRGEVDGGPMDAMASADRVAYLRRFLDEVGPPRSFAAIGCGDGTVPRVVASEFPDAAVWGYDVSDAVIARAREEHADLANLSFAVASLPDPDVDRSFDVVYCFATLPYVRDVERAVRDLYALVAPGGHLVVNYPNEEFCETYAAGIDEGRPHTSGSNWSVTVRTRFRASESKRCSARERMTTGRSSTHPTRCTERSRGIRA